MKKSGTKVSLFFGGYKNYVILPNVTMTNVDEMPVRSVERTRQKKLKIILVISEILINFEVEIKA